jgi:hypothetical protein
LVLSNIVSASEHVLTHGDSPLNRLSVLIAATTKCHEKNEAESPGDMKILKRSNFALLINLGKWSFCLIVSADSAKSPIKVIKN